MAKSYKHSKSNPVSLLALLSVCSGIGLLISLPRFNEVSQRTPPFVNFMLFAVALILLLWGANQILLSLRPARAQSRKSKSQQRRVTLPREGGSYLIIMIFLFVGSLLGRSNMLMLVFALMTGPFILNGWITFSLLRKNEIRRRVPKNAMAGQMISVEITVENQKRRISSWLMAVRDRIGNDYERLEADVLFARIPPRDSRTVSYQLKLHVRGRYQFGPVDITTRFPLGLVERGIVYPASGEILIHPRVGRIVGNWMQEILLAAELVERQTSRQGAFNDDFHGIREYRHGDDPRLIHWRTSARRNEMMVREFHQSRDQHLNVFLDLWTPKNAKASDHDRVELAVSFVATICLQHLRQSRDTSLMVETTGAEPVYWESQSGSMSIESMLDMLAIVEGGPSVDFELILANAIAKNTSQTRTVVVTTRTADQIELAGLNDTGGGSEVGYAPQVKVVEADQEQLSHFFILE